MMKWKIWVKANWDNSIVELITDKKVKLTMSAEQVLLSWGKPQNINQSIGSYGVHEQWIYGSGQYLYFENNVLTNMQTPR